MPNHPRPTDAASYRGAPLAAGRDGSPTYRCAGGCDAVVSAPNALCLACAAKDE